MVHDRHVPLTRLGHLVAMQLQRDAHRVRRRQLRRKRAAHARNQLLEVGARLARIVGNRNRVRRKALNRRLWIRKVQQPIARRGQVPCRQHVDQPRQRADRLGLVHRVTELVCLAVPRHNYIRRRNSRRERRRGRIARKWRCTGATRALDAIAQRVQLWMRLKRAVVDVARKQHRLSREHSAVPTRLRWQRRWLARRATRRHIASRTQTHGQRVRRVQVKLVVVQRQQAVEAKRVIDPVRSNRHDRHVAVLRKRLHLGALARRRDKVRHLVAQPVLMAATQRGHRRRNHLGVVRCHARTADHDARKDLTRVRRVQARWLRQAQRYGALDPRRLHVSSPRRAHTVTATGRSVLHQRTSAQCVVSVTRCVTRAWNASRVASAATSAATAPPRSSAAMIYSEMFCLFTHTSSRRAGATFSATTYATPPKRLAVMEKHARGALATWMSCTWLHVHLQRWRDGSPRHGS